jgi:2',3'-cyclic-nucleotide 2'-phosphodiesterase/3'-nucleotidase
VLALLLVLSIALPVAAAPSYVQIDILTVNDYHGALAETGKNPGAAKLAGWLRAERAKNPEGTLILSAGDMFQGSPDSNLLYGKTVVDVMNNIGFTAMTLGNHEFDWGMDTLKVRAKQARFPFVAANILDNKTNKAADFAKPYMLIEKQGVKIAIVGMATPESAYKASPKLVSGLTFADPAATFRELLPELKRQADIVIVLSHLGGAIDQQNGALTGEAAEFIEKSIGVDALITGHSHEGYAIKAQNVPVVQARYNGRAVGKISLLYAHGSKQVLASSAALIEMDPAILTADIGVAKILDAAKAEIDPVKNIVLGKTAHPLSHDRKQLSLLGQWSSDVIKQAVGTDIALQNGGGLRTSIPVGTVTMGQLYEVMPFDNTLVTAEMTGAQVLSVLEYGIRNEKIGMLQFAGIKVIYDASMPAGKRVVEVVMSDGKPLKLEGKYKVVTNDFMASGGDGFTMFKDAKNLTDTYQPVREVLVDAIRKQQTLNFVGDDRLTEVWSIMKQEKPAA